MDNFKTQGIKIAKATEDAYSFDRYASWPAVAGMLFRRGYNAQEVEAILRSKWTRWAADASNKPYGKATGADLARFLDDPRNNCTKAEVADLVRQTF